ncbi:hypothetical protein FOPE_05639 [Fonsecaea pedrosoi]|nr:hypothetical protein FOPE_05639 [Fonsecaea pedrosoi]
MALTSHDPKNTEPILSENISMAFGEAEYLEDCQVHSISADDTIDADTVDPETPPDGGWQAWKVVLGAFVAFMCSFGWLQCQSQSQILPSHTILSELAIKSANNELNP